MMRRARNTKIVATLGPASRTHGHIRTLFVAGADVFRINMSHTDHPMLKTLVDSIRAVEAEWPRLIAQVRREMLEGTDPTSARMRPLAIRWRELVRGCWTPEAMEQRLFDLLQRTVWADRPEELSASSGTSTIPRD